MNLSKEKLNKYFWYIFGVLGVVFFWAGLWDGSAQLQEILTEKYYDEAEGPTSPLYCLSSPFVFLVLGLILLAISGTIFRGSANPLWGEIDPIHTAVNEVWNHPSREEFIIHYYDNVQNKIMTAPAANLKEVEKEFMVFVVNNQEIFVPFRRMKAIMRKNTVHWKKE
jgi:hypothetical protein